LACHIRCTPSNNQTTSIIIYGVVDASYLFNNECFNILKTKNVSLTPFTKKSIFEATQKLFEVFSIEELPLEVSKLKFDVPKNYEDNHSVANEWAIFRWAKTLDIWDDATQKLDNIVNESLYFKYLQTILPVFPSDKVNDDDLKISSDLKPKILYIDDDIEVGWYLMFKKIFYNDIVSS
jgi:hypothetical protein